MAVRPASLSAFAIPLLLIFLPPALAEDKDDDGWIDASQRAWIGNDGQRVEVTKVVHGEPLAMTDGFRNWTLSDKWVVIHVRFSNGSKTKKIVFQSWGATSWSEDKHQARLTDDFKNNYRGLGLRLGDKIVAQVRDVSLNPGECVKDDVIVFEDVPKEREMRLELSGSAFERPKVAVKFRIPRKMHDPDYESPEDRERRLAALKQQIKKEQTEAAVDHQKKLAQEKAKKEAAALAKLKLTQDLEKEGRVEAAKLRYREILRDYAGTKAAKQAEDRLKKLSESRG